MSAMALPMAEVVLFEGSDRARVRVGERSWEDVQVFPLREGDLEPDGLVSPAVLVRAGRERATIIVEDALRIDADLFLARVQPDGTTREMPVRIKALRDRAEGEPEAAPEGPAKADPKADPFWSRVFRKKPGTE